MALIDVLLQLLQQRRFAANSWKTELTMPNHHVMIVMLANCIMTKLLLSLPLGNANVCDMDGIREWAEKPTDGGWRNVSTELADVIKLTKAAKSRATTSDGVRVHLATDPVVAEAFAQVGFWYFKLLCSKFTFYWSSQLYSYMWSHQLLLTRCIDPVNWSMQSEISSSEQRK